MAATGEVSNYLARNLILSGEAGSGERVGQDQLFNARHAVTEKQGFTKQK